MSSFIDINKQFDLALDFHQKGQVDHAAAAYLKIIEVNENHADAAHNLGVIYAQAGNFEQAVKYFNIAVKNSPENSVFLCNLATALNDFGQTREAITYFEKAKLLNSVSADIYYNLGNAYQKLNEFEKSIECYKKTLEINPNWLEAYLNCGNSLDELGKFNQALEYYDKIIAINPIYAAAYANKGNVLMKLNRPDEAVKLYDLSHKLGLNSLETYFISAEVMMKNGDYKKAIEMCLNGLRLNPHDHRFYFYLGMNYFHIRDLNLAVENFEKAISIKPDYAIAYNWLALSFAKAFYFKEAHENFEKALAYDPTLFIARVNSADAYYAAGDIVSALKEFQKLEHNLQPLGLMQFFKARLADWSNYDDEYNTFIASLDRPRFAGSMEDPWHIQRITDDLEVSKRVAKNFNKQPVVEYLKTDFKNRPKNSKIRIGYFSSDFREHAITHLTLELFKLRSKDKFEIYAFGFGKQHAATPELRAKIESSFDRYIDINQLNDIDAVKLARELNIDVAIDLSGITGDARPGIFSNRAAPIQVNYLGFTSTLGTDYHDYIIADPVVIPIVSREFYTEKVVHLPCVMPFDTSHALSGVKFKRHEQGLPEEGFIFCSFNQHFKINPETFDTWMRILKRVPGSYLWMSQPYEPEAIPNLKKEAASRGIDTSRIIFASRIKEVEKHLARIALADLFLDTFPYNAHTSAIDTLWAGVPIVTRMGRSFASRLAGSLLKSVGLDDLVTDNIKDYEELAVSLALNPAKLKNYRNLLEKNRSTHRLFNTKLYTKNFEKAIEQMYHKHLSGEPPDHIIIG
jgi:protein O-GlcNAc transferase